MKYELPSTELIVIEENNYLKFGEYLNDMQCDDTANKLSLDDLEYVKKLQQENQSLKKENKILRENAENNDKVIDMLSARLEYFLIGNLKYQSSQAEFIKLLKILKGEDY